MAICRVCKRDQPEDQLEWNLCRNRDVCTQMWLRRRKEIQAELEEKEAIPNPGARCP